MILGIGVDVCDVARLEAALARSPRLRARLFTDGEAGLSPASLAARVAVKEAVAKALHCRTMSWRDCWVERGPDGVPTLGTAGTVARRAAELGVTRWHLSLSHDGGVGVAMVIAERD